MSHKIRRKLIGTKEMHTHHDYTHKDYVHNETIQTHDIFNQWLEEVKRYTAERAVYFSKHEKDAFHHTSVEPLVDVEQKVVLTSREYAISKGLPTYVSDKPCTVGHGFKRYVKGAHCVICSNTRTKIQFELKRFERKANLLLKQEAIDAGQMTYKPYKPCKHGHTCNRYVSNNICVDCASDKNARQFNKRAKRGRT